MSSRRDVQLIATCGVVFLIGLVALAFGVWQIADASGVPVMGRGSAVVGGAILMGLSATEVVRRLRFGPQEPGRHSKPD